MKTFFRTSIAALAALFTMSSTTLAADKATKSYYDQDFKAISVAGPMNVIYTQGDDYSIKAEGMKENLKMLSVETKGARLVISIKNEKGTSRSMQLVGDKQLNVYVTAPALTAVEIAGSGDFVAKKGITGGNTFSISVAGSSDVVIPVLEAEEAVSLAVAGSGTINVKQVSTQDLQTSVAGSGDIKVSALGVANTNLSVAGSGRLNAEFGLDCNAVEASVAGSGEITVAGKVASFKQSVAGSGKINASACKVN